jgi:hypothetical protein
MDNSIIIENPNDVFHDHSSGEPIGFAHPRCNPRAEANEIFRLKAEVKKLQQEVQFLKAA